MPAISIDKGIGHGTSVLTLKEGRMVLRVMFIIFIIVACAEGNTIKVLGTTVRPGFKVSQGIGR